MPSTPRLDLNGLPSIYQGRSYQSWKIPRHTIIHVYAELIKKLYTVEVNKEHWVLRSNGPGHRNVFGIRMFGALYAIYDKHGIQSAIQTNGNVRHLTHEEKEVLDEDHSMFKIPENGLPNAPVPGLYGVPSKMPRYLQGTTYDYWQIPDELTVKVIQNLPRGSQRFYILETYKLYNVLRNAASAVFAIKEFDQLHLLYDRNNVQTVFHMTIGMTRKLLDDEKAYFDTRGDTIKQTVPKDELLENALPRQARLSQAGQKLMSDYPSSSSSSTDTKPLLQ